MIYACKEADEYEKKLKRSTKKYTNNYVEEDSAKNINNYIKED